MDEILSVINPSINKLQKIKEEIKLYELEREFLHFANVENLFLGGDKKYFRK